MQTVYLYEVKGDEKILIAGEKENSLLQVSSNNSFSFTERIYFSPDFDLLLKRGTAIMCNSCKKAQCFRNMLKINIYYR